LKGPPAPQSVVPETLNAAENITRNAADIRAGKIVSLAECLCRYTLKETRDTMVSNSQHHHGA
jgi:hypothetical protein